MRPNLAFPILILLTLFWGEAFAVPPPRIHSEADLEENETYIVLDGKKVEIEEIDQALEADPKSREWYEKAKSNEFYAKILFSAGFGFFVAGALAPWLSPRDTLYDKDGKAYSVASSEGIYTMLGCDVVAIALFLASGPFLSRYVGNYLKSINAFNGYYDQETKPQQASSVGIFTTQEKQNTLVGVGLSF